MSFEIEALEPREFLTGTPNLTVSASRLIYNQPINTSGRAQYVTITNTGRRAGSDVAQAYVAFPPSLGEPPRQLKGFKKVFLEPGESQPVSIPLDARAFSYWDSTNQDWRQGAGCYGVSVGDTSRSLLLSDVVAIAGGNCGARVLTACKSRRTILVHLRGVRHARVRRVAVYLNGRRTTTRRGPSKSVVLPLGGRAKGTVRVRFEPSRSLSL